MEIMATGPMPQKQRWRKMYVWLAVLMLLTCGLIWNLYLHDGAATNDADLSVRDPIAPEDQNGLAMLFDINTAPFEFDGFALEHGIDMETADKINAGDLRNDALMDAFLMQARPHFTEIDHVLDERYFVFNDSITANNIPTSLMCLEIVNALSLSAMRGQQTGDYGSALHDVMRLRKLGMRFCEGYKPLIFVATGSMFYHAYIYSCYELLNDPLLPVRDRTSLEAEFRDEAPWPSIYQHSLQIEYAYDVNLLHQFARYGGDSANASFLDSVSEKWMQVSLMEHSTQSQLANYYRAWINELNRPFSQFHIEATPQNFDIKLISASWTEMIRPNFGGRMFLYAFKPEKLAREVVVASDASLATDRELRVGFALRHYYDDNKSLPKKLTDLVPVYLPAVPTDPFDGKPLRYDLAKRLVYSVGTDLADHDGSKYLQMSKNSLNYENPLSDQAQPTLQLTFQNAPNGAAAR